MRLHCARVGDNDEETQAEAYPGSTGNLPNQSAGTLGESWSDWVGGLTITVESEGDDPPITTLTGTLDQAALHGLLRWLYSLGLPLISVNCVECGSKEVLMLIEAS